MHPTQEARLSTFEGRADVFPIELAKLAAAGFCWTPFTNSPASVRCEDCELVVKDIVDQADPIIAHRRARPDCPFVKSFDATKSADINKPIVKAPSVIKVLDTIKPAAAVITAPRIGQVSETVNLVSPAKTLSGAVETFKPAAAQFAASETVEAPKPISFAIPAKSLAAADIDVKPATTAAGCTDAKRVKHQHADSDVLIDISDCEPATIPTFQIFDLSEKIPAGPQSDTTKDLMEVFADVPSKAATVKQIVGALANRKIHEDAMDNSKDVPDSVATRPVPDDLRQCRHCQAMFEDRDKLFQHVYTNCGKDPKACPNPFPCRVCRQSFVTRKQLKRHLGYMHNIALWF